MSVRDYGSAVAFLVNEHTKQPVPRKKIANHTYVEKGGHITERGDQIHEGEIGIVLHETAVVVYGPGYIRLNTGGWLTTVTRERIDRFTPDHLRLTSDDAARWRLIYGRGPDGGYWDGPSCPYYDGITLIGSQGGHYSPNREDRGRDTSDEDAHNTMLRRLVKRYLKSLKDGEVTITFGACALCLWDDMPTMTGPYSTTAVIPNIGDKMADRQHLIDHMLENVLPRELELHACREVAGDIERAQIWVSIDSRRNEALRKFLLGRLLVGAVSMKHGRRPVTIPA